MKISSPLSISPQLQSRLESPESAAMYGFAEEMRAAMPCDSATTGAPATPTIAERSSFNAAMLAIRTALDPPRMQPSSQPIPVVSSESAPYLSSDEVHFFETIMPRETP